MYLTLALVCDTFHVSSEVCFFSMLTLEFGTLNFSHWVMALLMLATGCGTVDVDFGSLLPILVVVFGTSDFACGLSHY